MKRIVVVTAIAGLLSTGCGGDGGADPYRNAVSDKRAPEVVVSLRDDDGQPVADITYEAARGRIPSRGTYAFLQADDDDTWTTAYTLHGDGFVEGVPEGFDDPAFSGPGPDSYRLPDLDADDTYRICISFVVGHPATDATGCSAPFHDAWPSGSRPPALHSSPERIGKSRHLVSMVVWCRCGRD